MSLIVVGGQIVSGSPETYQAWDQSLSQNPSAVAQDNRGCAPGWATIYVLDSLTGNMVKVCRRLDQALLGPGGAAIIQAESGPDWYDQTAINVASAAQDVVGAVGAVLPSTWSMAALLIGAAALLFMWKK